LELEAAQMSKLTQWFCCLGVFIMLTSPASAEAYTPVEVAACDAMAIRWDEAPNLGSRMERAKGLEREGKSCLGKGIYDIRLAILYLDSGDYDNADRIAKQALKSKNSYAPSLRQILAQTTLSRGDASKAYKMALEIEKEFPKYVPILGILGQIAFQNRDWKSALHHSEKAFSLDPSAYALLAMADALHHLNRHEECIAAVQKALQLEPQRIAKAAGIKEAIYSYGVLKRNEEAAQLLKRHMQANPDWYQDSAMLTAAKALGLAK
jgi:tetratricopeptide (TPR) repeat protein